MHDGIRLRQLRWNLPHLGAALLLASLGVLLGWGWPAVWLALPAFALTALVVDGIARPTSSLFYPTVSRRSAKTGCVALTFDDGPDPIVTPRVLDELARVGAKATFFVIGHKLAAHPEIGKRIVAEGHLLGNHSWKHSRVQNFWNAKKHREEIIRCNRLIAGIQDPTVPIPYRPPVGLKSGPLGRAAYRCKLTLVAWSVHSHDTRSRTTPRDIATQVLQKVQEGDIILMHDGHDRAGHTRPHCVEALRSILQGFAARRLQCVTVTDLLRN